MDDERRPGSAIFKLRSKLMSISGDYWIEDEFGNRAFLLDGEPILSVRETLLQDAGGRDLFKIKYGIGRLRSKFQLSQQEKVVATGLRKFGFRPHYDVAMEGGDSFSVSGSLRTRKLEFTHEGIPMARTLHKFFEARKTVAVEVFDPADAPFVLAVMIAVDLSEEFNLRMSGA